jgi:hypothetical protein
MRAEYAINPCASSGAGFFLGLLPEVGCVRMVTKPVLPQRKNQKPPGALRRGRPWVIAKPIAESVPSIPW